MKKAILYLLPLVLFVGCSSNAELNDFRNSGSSASVSKSAGKSATTCAAPSKTYNNAELDNFLQSSYQICSDLQEGQELLTEANEFIADPSTFIAKKGAQAKVELQRQVGAMIASVAENVIKKAGFTLQSSGDATNAAKGLPGMDKLKAAKDVKTAVGNLKKAAETAPKIVDEMRTLLSKF